MPEERQTTVLREHLLAPRLYVDHFPAVVIADATLEAGELGWEAFVFLGVVSSKLVRSKKLRRQIADCSPHAPDVMPPPAPTLAFDKSSSKKLYRMA